MDCLSQIFDDDVDLLAEEKTELQLLIDQVHASSEDYGLKINTDKSKVLLFEKGGGRSPTTTVGTRVLECVDECVYRYLGSLKTANNDCFAENRRVNLASQSLGILKTLWSSSDLNSNTKVGNLARSTRQQTPGNS